MSFFLKLQGQIVQGKIVDGSDNVSLKFVTIVIKKDSVVYKVSKTDSLGKFLFRDLEEGKYNIEFSFINYKKKSMSFFLKYDTVINVALSVQSVQLKEVAVNARKPLIERKIDRLVFNVANDINISGLDALEVLSKTPEVKVDINNSVSIIGRGTVIVMIDDRVIQMSSDALAAYLRAIPAESIDRIEVITNPPAVYSANGSNGLINIVLKKKKELGYSGTANINITSPPSQTLSSNMSMNFNKKNIRYYGSLNSADGLHNPNFTTFILYPDRIQKASTKEIEKSQYIGGMVGFDADVSKTNSLGMSFNIFNSYPYQTNVVQTLFIDNRTKNIDSTSEQNNINKISYYQRSSNIHYVIKMDTLGKKRIVLDADWFSNGFDFPNKIESIIYGSNGLQLPGRSSQTVSNNTLSSSIYSVNGVFYLPLKKDQLSFGGKINFIKSDNYVGLYIDDRGQSINSTNTFSFLENTQALFINDQRAVGKKWMFQAGLRGEYTQTKGMSYSAIDSVNKSAYSKLFPTAYISYKLNPKNTLSINYGKRINRPGFNSFNPYRQYFSQYSYSEGNPYLQPSISNNFELSESYDNLNVSAQYSFSNGQVGSIGIVDTNSSITIVKPFNFLSTKSFVFSINYSFHKIKWLDNWNEFDVYYNRSFSSSAYTARLTDGWGANFRSDNTFVFNKSRTIFGGLYFNYQFPGISGINKFGRYYYVDLSAKYKLLNDRLQLSIRLSDIFKTLNIPFDNTINGIFTSNIVNNDSRRLTLSIRYDFGNSKLKKGEAHSADSNSGRAR